MFAFIKGIPEKMTFTEANMEIFRTLQSPYTWVTFAWEELRDRYQRSALGMLWIPVSFLLFVGVKVLVFSKLNQADIGAFSIHVVIGYWVWQTLNAFAIDSGHVFVRAGGYIKSSPLPYSVYVLQALFRNTVPFLSNFLITLVVCSLATGGLSVHFLWVIPAYLVLSLNAIWMFLLVGVIGARYRDIGHLIQTMMRVLFFITPIIWIPAQLGQTGEFIALINPFAHYINLLREPVASGTVPVLSWIIVLTITATGWVLATLVYSHNRRNIVHWV
jgi:ABC-type polysaccharide/polyol phosphate export permease